MKTQLKVAVINTDGLITPMSKMVDFIPSKGMIITEPILSEVERVVYSNGVYETLLKDIHCKQKHPDNKSYDEIMKTLIDIGFIGEQTYNKN